MARHPRSASAQDPALTASEYQARGCTYTFDLYEDGLMLVECWNANWDKVWEGWAQCDQHTRVIDAVRAARQAPTTFDL